MCVCGSGLLGQTVQRACSVCCIWQCARVAGLYVHVVSRVYCALLHVRWCVFVCLCLYSNVEAESSSLAEAVPLLLSCSRRLLMAMLALPMRVASSRRSGEAGGLAGAVTGCILGSRSYRLAKDVHVSRHFSCQTWLLFCRSIYSL